MRPDVEGLIGHLEEAEDAGSGGTLWVSVTKEDALLMEHLWREDREGKDRVSKFFKKVKRELEH